MRMPDGVVEIFLQPGEWYFGDKHTRIRTVLGSCVSAVFWHPGARVGGMCHFMLPTRGERHGRRPDGRYGDEAFGLLLDEIHRAGLDTSGVRVRLFGGGDMFPGVVSGATSKSVGRQNVEAALRLVERHRLLCSATHVEGYGHRHLVFDVWSGRVTMRHGVLPGPSRTTRKGISPCPPSR